ncbi:hypothetical protein [Shewanella sp. YLB-07]|uniref:hypothetical protein n=1 Tax=Shewanella sp. YLB-07 TaxID=2601268 RepID=UPI00128BFBF0|nr:hypothetical protein [Shewanella sp. YLB-07]MPY23926.1 hypothetical protein [Shewanella sp. YLB-07]
MELEALTLMKQLGAPITGAMAVFLLWRISSLMAEQKATLIKLIHDIDKRVTRLEAKNGV